jgi:ribose/xylose/arabinose/galactoside ABC-type transport system permease subunit
MSTFETHANPTRKTKAQVRHEARYAKRLEQVSGKLPGWRNQKSRRTLVVAFYVMLALMFLSGIALIGSLNGSLPQWLSLGWMIVTVLAAVPWTMLNTTVNLISQAPLSALDEYEAAQIESWKSLTYQLYNVLTMIVFVVLIFLGTYIFVSEPSWGHLVPYTVGLFGIILYLALSTLPTTAYAWNLQDE